MGRIISSYIFPHPPIIIPEVGRGEERDAAKTIEAVNKAAEDIKRDNPTTIILTTPHGPVFQDYIHISTDKILKGNLSKFGHDEVSLSFQNNSELVDKIIAYSRVEGIYAGGLEEQLRNKYSMSKEIDHGAIVPLYFIDKYLKGFKLVHISIAFMPFEDLYEFGRCISKAVKESDEQVVFVASGDMSHRLLKNGPNGFNIRGSEFDQLLVKSFKDLNVKGLFTIDEDFCEAAGECGLRSFLMMFGALDGNDITSDIYSYEGPFGVGYSVARFKIEKENKNKQLIKQLKEEKKHELERIRSTEDQYVRLARTALEEYINNKRIIKPDLSLPAEFLERKAGTFVSIKKQGMLRGCIGTIGPTRENIAEEIIYNAIASGTRDPRFEPVEEEELDSLVYSVDILREPEPIKDISELDVLKYGVIVKSGPRSGLLLPNLEGVDTPSKQVSISLQKAGIKESEKYSMERFEVIRHK